MALPEGISVRVIGSADSCYIRLELPSRGPLPARVILSITETKELLADLMRAHDEAVLTDRGDGAT